MSYNRRMQFVLLIFATIVTIVLAVVLFTNSDDSLSSRDQMRDVGRIVSRERRNGYPNYQKTAFGISYGQAWPKSFELKGWDGHFEVWSIYNSDRPIKTQVGFLEVLITIFKFVIKIAIISTLLFGIRCYYVYVFRT